jgi:DinB superfamily
VTGAPREVAQSDHLDALGARTQASTAVAHAIVAGLPEDRLAWSPAPGAWSIAQCLDHLVTGFAAYEAAFADAFARGERRGPPAPLARYRPTWVGGFMIRSLGPEVTMRFKVPKVFDPGAAARAGAPARFVASQRALESAIARARRVDIAAVRIASPAAWFIRYSLGDALTIVTGHVERHLAQARRVREAPGFPS